MLNALSQLMFHLDDYVSYLILLFYYFINLYWLYGGFRTFSLTANGDEDRRSMSINCNDQRFASVEYSRSWIEIKCILCFYYLI